MKITLELGDRRIDRCIRVEDRPMLFTWFEVDDFGVNCPFIGLLDKRLEHCDGRAAKIVLRDHRAIVLPQLKLEEGAAFATEQQQSVARARQQGQNCTGAARQGHRDQFAGHGDRVASRIDRSSQGNQQDFTRAGSPQDRSMQHSHRQGGQSKQGHKDRSMHQHQQGAQSQQSQGNQQDFTRAAAGSLQDRSMHQHSHQQGGQSKGSHNLANGARRIQAKSKWQRKTENGRVSGNGNGGDREHPSGNGIGNLYSS